MKLAFLLFLSLTILPAMAQGEDAQSAVETENEALLADWGGLRPKLQELGIESEAIITLDAVSGLDGGLKRNTAWLGNVDLSFTLDTAKAGAWADGTFFLYSIAPFGNRASDIVGDFQGTDNIESPIGTVRVLEAWYEHSFMEGAASLKAGLHDLNSEFGVLNSAAVLINGSFGLTPELSQTGASTYPETAIGARAAYRSATGFYGMGAIYDGVPGDPSHPHGTNIRLDDHDGSFSILETGYASAEDEPLQKLAVGGWYHTARFEDPAGEERNDNRGFYVLGERALLCEGEDYAQGLAAFLQAGTARPGVNTIGLYLGGGLQYAGLFPERDEDILAFGINQARTTSAFRRANEGYEKAETVVELTYNFKLTPYLFLQPDLQLVLDPGADPSIEDAWVSTIRLQAAL